MSNPETAILQSIRLFVPPDTILFRNEVGALPDRFGRLIRYGLTRGSSDLIGWRTIGGAAVFVAIEVKQPGARTKPALLASQRNFIEQVRAAGGAAGFADSVQDALDIIRGGKGCEPH